jgi:hypothetical protein
MSILKGETLVVLPLVNGREHTEVVFCRLSRFIGNQFLLARCLRVRGAYRHCSCRAPNSIVVLFQSIVPNQIIAQVQKGWYKDTATIPCSQEDAEIGLSRTICSEYWNHSTWGIHSSLYRMAMANIIFKTTTNYKHTHTNTPQARFIQ